MNLRSFIFLVSLVSVTSLSFAQEHNTTLGLEAGDSLTTGDFNTLYGFQAGYGISNRQLNVILGAQAGIGLLDTTAGDTLGSGAVVLTPFNLSDSVLIGYRAGWQSTTTATNSSADFTAIGNKAGQFNEGADNTFIGADSGRVNTTGFDNTFVGEDSGEDNTTGYDNTFVGGDAGIYNTTGFFNTFIGNESGAGDSSSGTSYLNTAIGSEALKDVETYNNTALGLQAGQEIREGVASTFLGSRAGQHCNYADFNVMIGAFAGWDNNRSNGNRSSRNLCIGTGAGYTNRQGEDNVVIGTFADSGIWEGDALLEENFNVPISSLIPNLISNAPINGNNDMSRQVMLGAHSRANKDDTVALGYKASALGQRAMAIGNLSSATHNDSIVIGYEASSHGNNVMVLGNDETAGIDPHTDGQTSLGSGLYRYASVTSQTYRFHADIGSNALLTFHADNGSEDDDTWTLEAADSGDFSLLSHAKGAPTSILSTDNSGEVVISGNIFVNSDRSLKKNIARIEGSSVLLSQLQGKEYYWKSGIGRSERKQYGLVAQEVETVIPELVTSGAAGVKSVNYLGLVPLLIDTTNEMHKANASLQATLEQESDLLDRELARLEQQLRDQKSRLKMLLPPSNKNHME